MQPKRRVGYTGDPNETVMAVIALGYRAEEPRTPRHRELDEIVKFF
ncbi:MAG: hypothetical protein IKR98_00880 [Bacteroidaceae bacterium]|nr:hypothetical protein [Bacteroidaceae bacterium]